MQTMYYTTRNFIRHTDNVVDLTEYRRRLARAQQEQTLNFELDCEDAPARTAVAGPRSAGLRTLSLENLASLGIFVMTLAFTVQVLFG